jgi:hypothetical protein
MTNMILNSFLCKDEGLLAQTNSFNRNWFARQNRLTEYWLRMKF